MDLLKWLFDAAFVSRFHQRRLAKSHHGNKYGRPHQGKREIARRLGGDAWNDVKAADRVRRGLAPKEN